MTGELRLGNLPDVSDILRAVVGNLDRLAPEFLPSRGGNDDIDIENGEKAVTVRAALPGVKSKDIDLEVLGDTLTIRATREEPELKENEHFVRRERSFGDFEVALKLPVPVKGAEAAASCVDGVLTVTLPKLDPQSETPHTIKINA